MLNDPIRYDPLPEERLQMRRIYTLNITNMLQIKQDVSRGKILKLVPMNGRRVYPRLFLKRHHYVPTAARYI